MLPTLPTPEVTFGPVSPENDCHRREYMPCEIMEGMAKCGLSSFTVSYTNQSTAFCRYRASRPAMQNIKNSIFRAFLTNFTPCLMSLFGLIPRFRYSMLVAGRKI